MLPRRQFQAYDTYPWSPSDTANRGGTAPRPDKVENLCVPSRIPTSSSKYSDIHTPNTKVSIKGSGWKSYKPREPIRTVSSNNPEYLQVKDSRPANNSINKSPSPTNVEHVWEEGSKRPKTQNEKCRSKGNELRMIKEFSDAFPGKSSGTCEIPIIVVKRDSKRVGNTKGNEAMKVGQRPSTYKPGKSRLTTTLDQEFLDLFQM